MRNAEIIAKIKAEIKRMLLLLGQGYDEIDRGQIAAYEHLLSFLSTLESEKPIDSEGLEEEIKRYYDDWDGDCRYVQTARHFAKWGAEHAKDNKEED